MYHSLRKGSALLLISLLFYVPVFSQAGFDWYLSNQGNDQNPGNSMVQPKQTLAAFSLQPASGGPTAGLLKIGFRAGDTFRERFEPGQPVLASTYFEAGTPQRFAVLEGSESCNTGWTPVGGYPQVFEQSFALSGFTGYGINNVGSYSMVYLTEYDRRREAREPISAGRLLRFVSSFEECARTPGSFWTPVTVNENPKKLYVHTSDSRSPNQHPDFRYTVCVRDRAINSTWQNGNRFENLWVRGYGAGNGMLPAGAGSQFNRMILGPGAGVHHLVLRQAAIDRTLFLPAAPNTSSLAVVFYDVEGYGRRNSLSNTLFMDLPSPLYVHTSGGSNY